MRSRAWVYTLNNYEDAEEASLKKVKSKYHVIGKEIGECGTPHLQGYIYFVNAKSFKTVKKLLGERCHIETRKGTHEEADEYCRKDGEFWVQGKSPEKVGGDNIEEKVQKYKRLITEPLKELVENGELHPRDVNNIKRARIILANEGFAYEHDDVRGLWIYGPPGTGKSHYARTKFGESMYIKAQNKWFCGYEGEDNILLDDFDHQGSCLGHYMKIWADKWSCNGEVKGGIVPLKHKRFIITSNYKPEEIWPDDDQMRRAIIRRFELIWMPVRRN